MTTRRRIRRLADRVAWSIWLNLGLCLAGLAVALVVLISQGNMMFPQQGVIHMPGKPLMFIGPHDPMPVLDHGHADLIR